MRFRREANREYTVELTSRALLQLAIFDLKGNTIGLLPAPPGPAFGPAPMQGQPFGADSTQRQTVRQPSWAR